MDPFTFVRGLVIGLSVGAPLGPVGLVCLRRMLTQSARAGLASGLGAATADAMFGAITGFGLTFITGPLEEYQEWLGGIGGLVLCVLGVRFMLSHPQLGAERVGRTGLLRAYSSTLLLTLTSPATVLSFVAMFAALGVVTRGRLSVGLLCAGVFAGSAFWWIALATAAGALRHHITPAGLMWVNRVSGALIAAFGVAVLVFGVGEP